MKAKQIEKLLTGVMKNFLDSIKENKIKDILKSTSFITGGCIPSMLIDEFVNDYDIYLHNEEDAQLVKDYFQNKHTHNKDDKFHVKLITDNAINLSDKIQVITKFTGTPYKVVENFDWKHIKSYYDCNTEKLFLTSDVYQLVCEKELVYTGSNYPLSSLMRLKKYIKKGWNVSNITILHIALDIIKVFNEAEKQRQYENAKHGIEQLENLRRRFETMSQEEFEELDKQIEDTHEPCQEIDDFEVITDPVELDFIDKSVNLNKEQTFNIEDIIHHLNGVDPLTIQAELIKESGKYLTISEIIKIMNKE